MQAVSEATEFRSDMFATEKTHAMKIMLFGASGMVGQGVLRECLLDDRVEKVLSIGRSASGRTHAKFAEIVLADLTRIEGLGSALEGYDACFDSLGTSSAGMAEVDYTRETYELTLTIAKALVSRNPGMTFIYVSGAGASQHTHHF